jgi:hypothetical protein
VTFGGVGMYILHQDAMSRNTDVFKMGMLQVTVSPNLFALGLYFNQTLDMSLGCMLLHAGGSDFASMALTLRCCVHAHSDQITVTTTSRSPSFLFNISAEVSSTRPPGVWQYKDAFAACDAVGRCTLIHRLSFSPEPLSFPDYFTRSQPDVAVDPLPPPSAPCPPPPLPLPQISSRDCAQSPPGPAGPSTFNRFIPTRIPYFLSPQHGCRRPHSAALSGDDSFDNTTIVLLPAWP